MKRKTLSVVVAACAAAAVVLSTNPNALSETRAASAAQQQRESSEYRVSGITTAAQRDAVAGTGAAINAEEHGGLDITATPDEVRRIQALGYRVQATEPAVLPGENSLAPQDFPSSDSNYHTYAEMVTELNKAASDHPTLVRKSVIGKSYEGRDIYAMKISDNVATDENEPEVLFTHHQHAREHLTVEMALYLVNQLTDNYATDSRIKNIVDGREIWILPDLNPDGGEYDIKTGSYAGWRKNRQPNSGSSAVGTDLNRNWDYKWGCCGGSSGSPSSETYRGASGNSAPEVRTVADFVNTRVVGGKQQITTGIDFHTFSELVLWPLGYTHDETGPDMTADDHETFVALGEGMAASNGYTPEQDSELYITDGSIDDYLWGKHKIFDFTFEMYPSDGGLDGFYPPDEVIGRETARNKESVLHLLEYADCPYRVIGRTCDGTTPPAGTSFENTTDLSIPDAGAAVTSTIAVTGIAGAAPAALKVEVHIKHPYRGDLVIDLLAPDGSAYRLKNSSNDSADNVDTTYTVNASSEVANGGWKLKIQDVGRADVGNLDSWKLTF